MNLANWLIFIKERFDPLSHVLMIGLFLVAHFALVGESQFMESDLFSTFCISIGVLFFFFKLRLYDEIKDYELDVKINPHRPLPRGLIKHKDVYRAIVFCILVELLCFSQLGMVPLVMMSGTILYSLLMYREFFIKDKIRPHLTTYAVLHTVVSAFLSLTVTSALTHQWPWEPGISEHAIFFAANSWCLFNIFEFGRKTFTSQEEREAVESYSKIFGRFGAVILVLGMAVASTWFLSELGTQSALKAFLGICLFTLSVAGFLYVILNRAPFGKLYRAMSSVYIILIYLGYSFIEF